MSSYVELDKQTSFTGDKSAIKWLPKGMQAAAAAEQDALVPDKKIITPSMVGPGSDAQRAALLAKAASAKEVTETGLMAKLKKAFTRGIQKQGEPVKEFGYYGDAKDDLLKAGLTALQAGAGAAAAKLDPAAAAAAKAKAEEEAKMEKMKMVGGALLLAGLGYYLFMRKKPARRKRRKKSRRKKR